MSLRILAIDTSFESCSAALHSDGQMYERHTEQPRQHAQRILPMVHELLQQAGITLSQVELMAFGRGPGAFTGLRIAAGVVQGLAFGAAIPVLPVSSLALLAQQAYTEKGWRHCHVAVDARMGEVYWGSFSILHNGTIELLGSEAVLPPDQIRFSSNLDGNNEYYGVGSGWAFRQQIEQGCGSVLDCDSTIQPRASSLITLAQKQIGTASLQHCDAIIQAHEVAPVYLRNNVAVKPGAGK